MIKINIIPPKKKREIALNKKTKIYFKFITILLINFTLYTLIFLAVRIITQKYYKETENRTLIANQSKPNYEEKIKTINEQIQYIKNIQDRFVNWSDFFIFLSTINKSGIVFQQININKTTNSLSLSGIADTRDDLLKLKKILENTETLTEIELPFSTLLEKNNITFEIKAKLNSYEF